MKKLIAYLFVLFLISSVVIAVGPDERGLNAASGVNSDNEVLRARNVSELKEIISERREEMKAELASLKSEKQEVLKNQNTVRLAVHALLAMENLTGGIGKNVSAIARNFNNSVQATIRAEDRIQNRSRIARFFNGGDQEAADEIEQEVNQNRNRIEQLQMLMERCNCTDEVKAMLQEQMQNMTQEQNRLGEVAQKEKTNKGLFGALFGWMRRK